MNVSWVLVVMLLAPIVALRFKHKLLSIDSTVFPLCLSVCDWARYKRVKGATLHLVLHHDGYLTGLRRSDRRQDRRRNRSSVDDVRARDDAARLLGTMTGG